MHGQSKAVLRNLLFSKLGRARAPALEEDLASQHVNIAITKYRLKNCFNDGIFGFTDVHSEHHIESFEAPSNQFGVRFHCLLLTGSIVAKTRRYSPLRGLYF